MGHNDKSTLFFLMLHFQILGPCDVHRVKIQVDQGFDKSPDHFQPLEPSNCNFETLNITYFCHFIPWRKIPEDMNKSVDKNRLVCSPKILMSRD